jgi:molybdopterin-guanine dinucleotide biosynthesis protein A
MITGMNSQGIIAGVLLAGGQSRRMGGDDKALRMLSGKPLMQHAINRMRPQARALAISANGDPQRFAEFGLPVLADTVAGFPGPLAGILAGMRWAAGFGLEWVATAACDTPFIPLDLVARLWAAGGGLYPAIAASAGREHPVCGLWPVDMADRLEEALAAGQRRVYGWAVSQGVVFVDFPLASAGGSTVDPFLNINTPEDLQEAERIAARFLTAPLFPGET